MLGVYGVYVVHPMGTPLHIPVGLQLCMYICIRSYIYPCVLCDRYNRFMKKYNNVIDCKFVVLRKILHVCGDGNRLHPSLVNTLYTLVGFLHACPLPYSVLQGNRYLIPGSASNFYWKIENNK